MNTMYRVQKPGLWCPVKQFRKLIWESELWIPICSPYLCVSTDLSKISVSMLLRKAVGYKKMTNSLANVA